MAAKGKDEKEKEQVQFAAYKQFCEDTSSEKTAAIAKAEETIEILKADIQEYTATAAKLGKEIAAHDEDISVWEGDMKAATKVRDMEKADYDALHKDYSESVDALTRAIAVLKKQAAGKKQAASLVQVSALTEMTLIPKEAKYVINAFLQQDPADEGLAVSAPEAAGYDFQSSGVIEMLEKLQDKFMAEREALEKEETEKSNSFDMLIQELTAQKDQATKDSTEKSESKAQNLQAKADSEGSLQDTTSTMEADKTYLTDLVSTCEQKAMDFESRQTLRAEELEAVQKAIDIVSSGAVAGSADKHLPSLLQKGSSLAMLRADLSSNNQDKTKAHTMMTG